MSEETQKPTPREIELQNVLKDSGIAIHQSGFAYDINTLLSDDYRPAIAIWGQSQIPTKDEIEKIKLFAEAFISDFESTKDLSAIGISTHTLFKKDNGNWTFRNMTWQIGPTWYPIEGSLDSIGEHISSRIPKYIKENKSIK